MRVLKRGFTRAAHTRAGRGGPAKLLPQEGCSASSPKGSELSVSIVLQPHYFVHLGETCPLVSESLEGVILRV